MESLIILIVEDNPTTRKLLRMTLELEGYRVHEAADARAALACASSETPDLILQDLILPDMDGLQLMRSLRGLPGKGDTPILGLSGFATLLEKARSLPQGFDACLEKPVEPARLLDTVRRLLARAARKISEEVAASPAQDREPALPGAASPVAADEAAGLDPALPDRLAQQLAQQTAANADLIRRCALQEAQLSILGGVADALTRSADLESVLVDLLPACLDAGGITRGALYRCDASDKLVMSRAVGFPDAGALEKPFLDLLDRVIAGRVAVTSDSLAEAEARTLLSRIGSGAGLIVPLVGNGHGLGALVLGSDAADVTEHDLLAFGRAIGAYMGQALALGRAFARLDEANRTRDEFLATVSHELRTPLNAILGWAAILRSGPYDSAQLDKGLATIERNGKAQVRLIEDILDVSRIITGKLGLRFDRVTMVPVVRAAIDVLLPTANAKEVQIVATLDPDTNPIEGDADRLRQVIWNLLSNAVKFTPRGGRIDVRLERTASAITIRVTDTGRGIRAEFLPHIFERFRQADGSTTRGHGGLGLGMAIARHLVELHGGIIRAESPGEGHGATFTVELPIRAVLAERRIDDTKPGGIAARVPIARVLLRGVKVLVVDDEADARDLVRVLLAHEGAEVRLAGSADEAIEVLREFPAQVLVSDIGMPGEDGYELIQRVRAITSRTREWIPAIALTAYARSSDVEAALNAGFQKHLAKPVEPAELVKTVAVLARQSQRSSG